MTNARVHEIEPQVRKEINAKKEAPAKFEQPSNMRATLIRWLKFNFVGGIGIAVQFAALFLLKGMFHLNYLIATAIAVEAAVVHNFLWHEKFTWVDRIKIDRVDTRLRPSLLRFVRFNLSAGAVSILGNLGLMKMLVGQGHMNYLLANAIAIVLCSLANFLVSDEWVFDCNIR
jgi:putative flippase GtrA